MTYPYLGFLKDRLETSPRKIGDAWASLLPEERNILTMSKFIGRYLLKGVLLVSLALTAWILFTHLPVNYTDWIHTFRPAALNWQNPYHREAMVFNPPWIFPLLYPLAALPNPAGASLLVIISVIAVAMYAGSIKKTLIVAASAPMAAFFVLGQLDGLLLFGLMLPYGLGLPILLAKPQGVFLAVLPRLNRWSILLLLLVLGVSIFVWGDWWRNIIGHRPNSQANMSLFPYTIILGIPLAYAGLKRKSDAFLCAASLCFAPYFMAQSMLPMIAAIVRETENWRWWSVAVVGSWVYEAAMKGFLW